MEFRYASAELELWTLPSLNMVSVRTDSGAADLELKQRYKTVISYERGGKAEEVYTVV